MLLEKFYSAKKYIKLCLKFDKQSYHSTELLNIMLHETVKCLPPKNKPAVMYYMFWTSHKQKQCFSHHQTSNSQQEITTISKFSCQLSVAAAIQLVGELTKYMY